MSIEIIPYLWISLKELLSIDFLQKKHVRLIINCSNTINSIDYNDAEEITINIDEENIMEANVKLYNKLPSYISTIHEYLCKNKSILIYGGNQISPTIIAAYLMKYAKVSKEAAVDMIRSKAPSLFQSKLVFDWTLSK